MVYTRSRASPDAREFTRVNGVHTRGIDFRVSSIKTCARDAYLWIVISRCFSQRIEASGQEGAAFALSRKRAFATLALTVGIRSTAATLSIVTVITKGRTSTERRAGNYESLVGRDTLYSYTAKVSVYFVLRDILKFRFSL